jgi:hypothetical protein
MTEEDTFNALRRDPFRKVFVECVQYARAGAEVFSTLSEAIEGIIAKSGWTKEELDKELNRQMELGNIHLSVTKLRDPVEQQKFLETGII